MKKIITFFNPIITLILFLLFIIVYLSVNYISQNSELSVKHIYIRTAQFFNFFLLLPGIILFLIISIHNFNESKKNRNHKNIFISSIPIFIIIVYFLYIFSMLIYGFINSDYLR